MKLDDIRVIDLTRLLPGPYGTQMLADMGAEIIKIEPPGTGDYAREMEPIIDGVGSIFSSTNRDKKSVTLNLKTDKGREILYSFVEEADVVFEQFRPGVVERLGVDYETVKKYNSEIIYCSLSGYGQTGPYSDRAGHDLNYIGYAGLLDMTRQSDDERPHIPGYPIADMAGGLFSAFSILGALLSRELGHGGEYIDVAMTDVVMSFSQTITPIAATNQSPRPGETLLTGKYPCYDVYETADGRYVAFAALEHHFWVEFCEEINRPDLVDFHQSEDSEKVEYVREELKQIFRSKTMEDWNEQLAGRDVMVSPVKAPEEALEDPQIQARDLIKDDTPDTSPRVGFPARAQGREESSETIPELGEHTREVLKEHGYDNMGSLRKDGVI